MKAILILDEMPKTCYECPLMSGDMYCKGFIPYTYENVVITKMCVEDYVMIGTRHSHCHLKPIPQKKEAKEIKHFEDFVYVKTEYDLIENKIVGKIKYDIETIFNEGYNSCLDEILGGEE